MGEKIITHTQKYRGWYHKRIEEKKMKSVICLKAEVGKKRRRGQGKGSSFERTICKQLSLWWTDGERDDIFWRTSGSGARATTRSKSGQGTKNQYGDVQATDPIGQPLIDLCTIEIKKGYRHHSFYDLLDKQERETEQPYRLFMQQAEDQQREAETFSWMLITARDRKKPVIAMPVELKRLLMQVEGEPAGCFPQMTFRFCTYKHDDCVQKIFVTTLEEFMENVDPECFRRAVSK